MRKALSVLLLLMSFTAFAIEKPPETEGEEEIAVNEGDVLELDRMAVQGEMLTLQKETRLRIVRQAMDEPRSSKKEDRDKMLCWLETPVGTHFRHVTCARNGDLDALRNGGKDGQVGGSAGYGRHKFWRSIQADNEATIRNIMADLPENGYFDYEFSIIASKGGEPPRDVPEEEELHHFVRAWLQVQDLTTQEKPESEVVAAIEAEKLTLKRYNRIAVLADSYQSIKAKITEFAIEEQNKEAPTS
jgi:hypothetical protein